MLARLYSQLMDDDRLWALFSAHSLAEVEWTHEAHVRTAYLFSVRFDHDEAHLRLRAGIIRLNERHGVNETSQRGYAETLTRAWLTIVREAWLGSAAQNTSELFLLRPDLRDRSLPLRHYSRELLSSVRARALFVEPDLLPLPTLR